MRLRWILPILKYEAYGRFMKSVNQALGFSNHDVAAFRLRCVEILRTQGYAGVKIAFPTVSRRSVFRWQQSYLASEKKLSSLIPISTKPHQSRMMIVPAQVLSFLKSLRRQHPQLSKYKLKIFLDEFCREKDIKLYSTSWIGKVISRHQFFFNTRKPIKKNRKTTQNKLRIWRCPRQTDISLGYLQADGIKVVWNGQTLYFLCAVELKSRQAWAKRVPSLSSIQARTFLQEIMVQVTYPIHTIQTDNGSEFAKYFDVALLELSITHAWSKPHSPKVNGYVERFNGVIQAEFIDYYVDVGVMDTKAFDQSLQEWLVYYNTQRPHFGLNLKTPQQYLLDYHQLSIQSAKCV